MSVMLCARFMYVLQSFANAERQAKLLRKQSLVQKLQVEYEKVIVCISPIPPW